MKNTKEAKMLKIMEENHSSIIYKTILSNYSSFHLQIYTLLEYISRMPHLIYFTV